MISSLGIVIADAVAEVDADVIIGESTLSVDSIGEGHPQDDTLDDSSHSGERLERLGALLGLSFTRRNGSIFSRIGMLLLWSWKDLLRVTIASFGASFVRRMAGWIRFLLGTLGLKCSFSDEWKMLPYVGRSVSLGNRAWLDSLSSPSSKKVKTGNW